MTDLTEHLVILPKLFRRLAQYFALSAGSVSLDRFGSFLATNNDRLFVIPESRNTGLDNIVTVDGQTVRLNYEPEDLIFIEG